MEEQDLPKILIIDDDEVLLATTEALLRAEGYEVVTHTGAFGGLSAISQVRPDLVLLDINMPGLSGPGLAALVKDEPALAGVDLFYFSSSDVEILDAAVREAGIRGYVRKGDRNELRAQVAKALRERRARTT